jgi:hypothetical protein
MNADQFLKSESAFIRVDPRLKFFLVAALDYPATYLVVIGRDLRFRLFSHTFLLFPLCAEDFKDRALIN